MRVTHSRGRTIMLRVTGGCAVAFALLACSQGSSDDMRILGDTGAFPLTTPGTPTPVERATIPVLRPLPEAGPDTPPTDPSPPPPPPPPPAEPDPRLRDSVIHGPLFPIPVRDTNATPES